MFAVCWQAWTLLLHIYTGGVARAACYQCSSNSFSNLSVSIQDGYQHSDSNTKLLKVRHIKRKKKHLKHIGQMNVRQLKNRDHYLYAITVQMILVYFKKAKVLCQIWFFCLFLRLKMIQFISLFEIKHALQLYLEGKIFKNVLVGPGVNEELLVDMLLSLRFIKEDVCMV